ncbi:PH domain-containing protein [Pseudonocardia sp. ICBG601]|uniref:PH domain-containing protein n=1 Tax=Pseudonocardia sp. ICBG601 TaxID=2846759 RepID=UPI001CF686E7|nr:PH domain-containing protein [Pseudonocardia sp. ICBG601]
MSEPGHTGHRDEPADRYRGGPPPAHDHPADRYRSEPAPAPDHPVAGADPGSGGFSESPWRRLPGRMLLVAPGTALLRLAPALVVLVLFGAGSGHRAQVWIAGAAVVLAVAAGVVRWRTTRYRITDERVELHSGLLNRQRRSVPRDRIRTVDLTTPLLHRMVGVSVVKVGSGQGGRDSGLDLDAVTTDEAERLRRELLARPGPAHGRAGADNGTPENETAENGTDGDARVPVGPSDPAEPGGERLDRIDWSSLRYAPLTVSSLAAIGALAGAGWNLLNETGLDPRSLPGADAVAGELSAAPVWATVLVAVGLLLLVMVAGSIVLFVERWWDYRLSREPDGTLRVRRGLLTKRSLSVSEQRLRGVTVSEPLLVRALGGGAQAGALTVGLAGEDKDSGGGALGPPVRRAHAHAVAATAARATGPVTDGPLRAHPARARTRRLVRAVGPALVPAAVLGVLAWFDAAVWPVVVGVALVMLAVPLALDRYRALGHRLDERYLVARHGSLLRTTTALRRDGVIGWRVRQSLFQRRAGVLTLEATTAAGGGAVQVLDLNPADAVALMAAVTPDAVAPFRA